MQARTLPGVALVPRNPDVLWDGASKTK